MTEQPVAVVYSGQKQAEYKEKEAQSPRAVQERVQRAQRDIDNECLPSTKIPARSSEAAWELIDQLQALRKQKGFADNDVVPRVRFKDDQVSVEFETSSPIARSETAAFLQNDGVRGVIESFKAENARNESQNLAAILAKAGFNKEILRGFEDQMPALKGQQSGPLPQEVNNQGQKQVQQQRDMHPHLRH